MYDIGIDTILVKIQKNITLIHKGIRVSMSSRILLHN